jgi:hypothetical protein
MARRNDNNREHQDRHNAGQAFLTLQFFVVPEQADQQLRAEDSHLCGQDHYVGRYLLEETCLQTDYTVKGPNKDYHIKSVLTR